MIDSPVSLCAYRKSLLIAQVETKGRRGGATFNWAKSARVDHERAWLFSGISKRTTILPIATAMIDYSSTDDVVWPPDHVDTKRPVRWLGRDLKGPNKFSFF